MATKDAASFISEIAFRVPFAVPRQIEQDTGTWIEKGTLLQGEEPERLSSWQGVRDAIGDSLEAAGVSKRYTHALAAYLYSCYLNHFPVLLAGPFGREIADALSCVMTGRLADYLDCSLCRYREAVQEFNQLHDTILVVDHPFSHEWVGHIGAFSAKEDEFTVFVHPFQEDLIIEPAGILNYMMPVLTELVVDRVPDRSFFSCQIDPKIRSFEKGEAKNDHRRLLLQRFHMMPFVYNRFSRVLSDMHRMCADGNVDYDAVLFLAPAAILLGKTKELVERINDTQFEFPQNSKLRITQPAKKVQPTRYPRICIWAGSALSGLKYPRIPERALERMMLIPSAIL